MPAPPSHAAAAPGARPWTVALLFVGAFALVRLAVLFATPLELYPDEAQYWLWSRELAFGYYSKPPMVAWLIALTTGIGGDEEPWVRLSSLFLHAGAALALFGVGRRLYDARTGLWAAVLYSLMPGVQLSAGIVSTDAALLMFLSLALLAYVSLPGSAGGRRAWLALGFGAALGCAFLSKYAALYLLLGIAAHLVLSRQARRAWTPGAAAAAAGGFALLAAPNLVWNALNGFATVGHTAANANWDAADLLHPGEMLSFLADQLAVFGPVPFVVLALGTWLGWRRRRDLAEADRLLLCLVLPPLLLVTLQALLSRANANWAGAAYAPGSVLVAAWLVRWGARRTLAAAVASQGVLAAVVMAAAVSAPLADALGLANGLKRARGWAESTDRVLDAAEAAGPVEAVVVDDRFLFNAAAYYGRRRLAAPGAPPLKMWVREAHPQNQAELTDPLTSALGGRVVVGSIEPRFRHELAADFERITPWRPSPVRLDARRERDLALAVAEGFAPRPRDPLSGLPTPP